MSEEYNSHIPYALMCTRIWGLRTLRVCAWQGTNVKGGKNATEVEPAGEKAKDMPSKASRICRGFKRMYAHPADVDPAKRRPPQAQVTS